MAAYRDELDAARTRIRVLEAQLQEQRATNEAHQASMVARQTELEAIESELEQARAQHCTEPRTGRSIGWEALATLAVAALLVSVGVSEAIDRAERARSALRHERLSWKLERSDKEFALASVRAENQRLRRLVREQEKDPDVAIPIRDPFTQAGPQDDEPASLSPSLAPSLAPSVDPSLAPSVDPSLSPPLADRDALLAKLRRGEAATHEIRLLRALCESEDSVCHRLATSALKLRLSMGQED